MHSTHKLQPHKLLTVAKGATGGMGVLKNLLVLHFQSLSLVIPLLLRQCFRRLVLFRPCLPWWPKIKLELMEIELELTKKLSSFVVKKLIRQRSIDRKKFGSVGRKPLDVRELKRRTLNLNRSWSSKNILLSKKINILKRVKNGRE